MGFFSGPYTRETEAAAEEFHKKKLLLKCLHYSQENSFVGVPF